MVEPAQRLMTLFLLSFITQGVLGVRWVCVTGGANSDSPQLSTTECLNPTTGSWQLHPSLTLPSPSRFMTPINFGDVACLVGGDDGTSFTPKRLLCTSAPSLSDPASIPTQTTSEWVELDTLPSSTQAAAAVYGEGWMGVAGDGWRTTALPTVGLTGPAGGSALTWVDRNTTAPLPHLAFSAVLPIGGKSCLVGGEENSVASTTTRCLTRVSTVLATDDGLRWTAGPNLNSARYSHTALQINGKWCVAGGEDGTSQFNSVECLSTAGTFEVASSYRLTAPLYGATNATIEGMPCLIGGASGSLTSNGVWCVNTSINMWVARPSLNIARRYHASFYIDVPDPSTPGGSRPMSSGIIAGIAVAVLIGVIACVALFALFRYESRFHHNVKQPLIERVRFGTEAKRGPPDAREMALESALTLCQSTVKGEITPQSKQGLQHLMGSIKEQQRELEDVPHKNVKSSELIELEVRESDSGQKAREQGLTTQEFDEDQLEFVNTLVQGERHWGSSLYRLNKPREGSPETITHTEVVVRRPQFPENFEAEVKLWRSVGLHPNVARIMGVAKFADFKGIVMEYYEGGCLQHTLSAERTTEDLLKIAIGLARGLQHLHKCKVVHRELALRNILVASDGRVIISDFENSSTRALNENDTYHIATLAPEIIVKPKDGSKRVFNDKTDIWALGVTLWELATRRHAYAVELGQFAKLDLLKEKIAHGSVVLDLKPVALEHPALIPALVGCLQRDPLLRPTAEQLRWLLKDTPAGNSIDRSAYISRL